MAFLLGAVIACGIPQEEHDAALGAQKAAMGAEMKKMQEANTAALADKDESIALLKSDVGRLNGSLQRVNEELDHQGVDNADSRRLSCGEQTAVDAADDEYR